MPETVEQEAVRVRAEVAKEMEAEDLGTSVDAAADAPATKDEPGEKTVDPWEGLNPELKKTFDEMSQRLGSLQAAEQRLKQAESRIGAITNELSAAKKAAETAREAPTAEQMATAAASDEKWESLKKDFPEWAEAFDGRFDKKLSATVTALKADIDALKGQGATEGKSDTDISEEVEKRLLSFFHPSWQKDIATNEWKEWLALQPPDKQALVGSTSASDAVALLDAFKDKQTQKTATQIAEERRKRLKTGELPQGGKSTPVKSEADMTAEELRANIGKEIFAET